jgi:hypothetical protein
VTEQRGRPPLSSIPESDTGNVVVDPVFTAGSGSLQMALIHNGDKARLSALIPRLRGLAEHLHSTVVEHSWQPPVQSCDYSVVSMFHHGRRAERIHRSHRAFRGAGKGQATLPVALRTALRAVRSKAPREHFRPAVVEQLLTDKHARAWTSFVGSGSDFLAVFEDDVIFRDDSIDRFTAVLDSFDHPVVDSIYLDLAGGFPLDKIVPRSVTRVRLGETLRFAIPFANTTAGYLISRPLAERILTVLAWRPGLRRLGPGWLLNELLATTHRVDPVVCLHADPPIFDHGTFTGAYPSTIQARPAPRASGRRPAD